MIIGNRRLISTYTVGLTVLATAAAADTRLADAAKNQDREAVRTALRRGDDVNGKQPDGTTALHWAAEWNDLETADLLIKARASANVANDLGVTPLSLACTNGSSEMVLRLLNAGANANTSLPDGETPLMIAARTGHPDTVAALLGHGALVNAVEYTEMQNALMWAIDGQHNEVARLLITEGADIEARSKRGYTPLLFAARVGNGEGVRMLLAHGAHLNEVASDGASPVLLATVRGHAKLAESLLDEGADPNADGAGFTPLHWASGTWETYLTGVFGIQNNPLSGLQQDKLGLVRALLAHGANPNARLKKAPPRFGYTDLRLSLVGATPFLLAAMAADRQMMQVLVDHGADPLLATEENTTPLMVAAGVGRIQGVSPVTENSAIDTVKMIIRLGGKVTDANVLGNTALHGVAYLGWNNLIQLLVDNGADVNAINKQRETPLLIAEGKAERLSLAVVIHEDTAALLRKLGADEKLGVPNSINR
jgi:ankyrin repeat protein